MLLWAWLQRQLEAHDVDGPAGRCHARQQETEDRDGEHRDQALGEPAHGERPEPDRELWTLRALHLRQKLGLVRHRAPKMAARLLNPQQIDLAQAADAGAGEGQPQAPSACETA